MLLAEVTMYVNNILDKYETKFSSSYKLFQRFKEIFPKGVCHDVRKFDPFPFITEKANSIYLFDVDNNKLIDLWMGHYANIMGHNPKEITSKVNNIIENGKHTGTTNIYQLKLAEKIIETVPEIEKLRFCCSGTEATMYASRIARYYTGKEIIVKVEGGWHGGSTELGFAIFPPFDNNGYKDNKSISIPFNEIDKTENILEKFAGEIAGIIIEPVLGSGGSVKSDENFMLSLRKFCDKYGAVLIFDEIITGFRFRYGSFSPILGVKPDIITMGKIIGGGFHIGMYGGNKDIMNVIEKQNIIVGGGTYSANPVSMTAGLEMLHLLEKQHYKRLNEAGESMITNIDNYIDQLGINAIVTGYGSFFSLHFLNTDREKIDPHKPSTFTTCIDKERNALFTILMLLEGIYSVHCNGALSFLHLEKKIINTILNSYKTVLKTIQDISIEK